MMWGWFSSQMLISCVRGLPMSTLRLAVIGAGVVGRSHAQRIAGASFCSLAGICDNDPNRRNVATEHNSGFYADTDILLQQESPDGVIIATPNASHGRLASECLARGVPVLVEKPISDLLESAHDIVTASDQAGVPVLVGHHRRHSTAVRRTKQLLENHAIGELIALSLMWALKKPDDYFDVDWRSRPPGGGPVLINLIHELDTLRFLCGEIDRVYAQASSQTRQLEVEDTVSISLSLRSGVIATLLACDSTPSPWSYEATTHENPLYFESTENCYHFLGTEGGLAFPRLEIWRHDDPSAVGWQHPLTRHTEEIGTRDPLDTQLEHFCDVIRGDVQPLVDARDATRSLAVAHAVLESIQTQQPVTVVP